MHYRSGCGEGYYLSQLKRCLESQRPVWNIRYFGLDISKAAIKLAAKQHRANQFRRRRCQTQDSFCQQVGSSPAEHLLPKAGHGV